MTDTATAAPSTRTSDGLSAASGHTGPHLPEPEPLWREVVGDVLRTQRTDRGETLADTSRRAGISPQYLSEIERGLKEPSSEMLAAVAGALELTLLDLTLGVAARMAVAAPVLGIRNAYALAA